LRELSAHIQEVQEEERLRIAREVHDELGQSLTAIKMDVSMLKNQLPHAESGIEKRTSSILSLVNSTIKTVQRISAELRPSLLDDLGLAAAIEWQAKQFQERSQVGITVDAEDVSIQREHAIAIFRIFQESVTNVARHAHATSVEARFLHERDHLIFQIVDNGTGFDPEAAKAGKSLGLVGMQERALLLCGEFKTEGKPGTGTTVTLALPLRPLPATEKTKP